MIQWQVLVSASPMTLSGDFRDPAGALIDFQGSFLLGKYKLHFCFLPPRPVETFSLLRLLATEFRAVIASSREQGPVPDLHLLASLSFSHILAPQMPTAFKRALGCLHAVLFVSVQFLRKLLRQTSVCHKLGCWYQAELPSSDHKS